MTALAGQVQYATLGHRPAILLTSHDAALHCAVNGG